MKSSCFISLKSSSSINSALLLGLMLFVANASNLVQAMNTDRNYQHHAKVLSRANEIAKGGRFHYHYQLDDGSHATQEGVLKHVPGEYAGESVSGKYGFVDKHDGKEYSVSYVADELGYRPVGDHLPTPPPTPPHILKQLLYLQQHPWQEEEERYARKPRRH